MRVNLQPAFILHRQPYRNTSLLLEVWTLAYGRVGLVARGVRAPRSRLQPLLQPFLPLLLSWTGKGELPTLTGAEEAGPAITLTPERVWSGFYVNELIWRLTKRHDPHAGLFAAYQQVLMALAQQTSQEVALRVFEKRLLSEIGYGLHLECEALTGQPLEPDHIYLYVLDQGPIAVAAHQDGIDISGNGLLALHGESLDKHNRGILRETKRLTRAAIDVQLQGRPLKTRELLSEHYRRRQAHML
jgi:DNA repair protein RecO (recombination protein O)